MLNFMNKKRKNNGFTLIELIIVIAIIAILAAIAVPKFLQVKEKANIKADIATAKEIATTVQSITANEEFDSTELGQIQAANGVTIAHSNNTGTAKKITDELDTKDFTPKSRSHSSDTFSVLIDSNNDVKVNIGSDVAYPVTEATGVYAKGTV